MPQLQVIAHHHIAAGEDLEEIFALYARLTEASRAEPGNVSFEVYRQVGAERSVVILERYASAEAFAEHQQTPHFTGLLLGQLVPRLDKRWREAYDVAD
ncbi:Antibiotic biosynthesis monooxygenase [Streptomyces sp. DvalAA-14]|uniref:putative quinol monooxygenase n=1 Tax=unclassified Streptomyces TaxID=2593676 RepID=UPI00081B9365|nr:MULTISPECIES: putative quinol monooxygenase [unclassified Streptomyces]MYS24035.1 antibiotic biosynthesis monooxygenase [Streptomyces sp. SID4948]SCE41861.1 Antibiotic biosynthesis monooxygenase [Streptomyces sp. DvalAA-14]